MEFVIPINLLIYIIIYNITTIINEILRIH